MKQLDRWELALFVAGLAALIGSLFLPIMYSPFAPEGVPPIGGSFLFVLFLSPFVTGGGNDVLAVLMFASGIGSLFTLTLPFMIGRARSENGGILVFAVVASVLASAAILPVGKPGPDLFLGYYVWVAGQALVAGAVWTIWHRSRSNAV